MIKLLLKSGEESRELTYLEPEVSIGRSSENVLQLADKKVSRKHARIEKAGDEYKLVDLGSGNGVRLNDREVAGSQALAKGDEIKIGLSSLFVLDLDTPPKAAAPAALLPVAAEAPPPAPAAPAPQAEAAPAGAAATERFGPRATRRSFRPASSSSSGKVVAVAAVLCIVAAIGYAVVLYKDQIFKSPEVAKREAKKPEANPAKEAAERLKDVRARAASPEPVTEAFVTEVSALNDRHGQAEPEFGMILAQLRERLAAQIGRMTFSEVEARVNQALKEKRYGDALESLRPLKKDAGAAALMEKALAEIRTDHQSVRELGKRLEEQKQYTLAATHYRDQAGRFKGTEYYKTLSDKPAMLELLAKAELEAAARPAEKPVEVALAPKPAEPEPPKPAPEPPKPAMEAPKPMAKPAMDPPKPAMEPPKPAPKPPEPPKPAPKPPEPPKPEPEPAKPEPASASPSIKKPAVLCECRRTVKGNYCVKCERTLETDDLRKGVCKRCEEKPKKIDICVKIYFQAACHPEKVDDKPVFC